MLTREIKIFCSYSHRDEELREELEDHLALLRREGLVTVWTDRNIEAGDQWRQQIDDNLDTANIVLLLISASFLDSDYCYNIEMTRALQRHHKNQVRVIPVLLRACDWRTATVGTGDNRVALADLQVLPTSPPPYSDLRPVTLWENRDEAYATVVNGVRRVVEEITKSGGIEQKIRSSERMIQTVPVLLPHLCDRSRQERLLKTAIDDWKHLKANRPLVCIIHGDARECHEMYQQRLVEETLPRLLKKKATLSPEVSHDQSAPGPMEGTSEQTEISIESIFIPLKDAFPVRVPFEFLRSELGQALVDDIDASPKAIATAISQYKKAIMFYSYLGSFEWERDRKKIIEAYLRFWNALPDVSSGPPIICCLFFKYHEMSGEESNTAARRYFGSLSATFSSYRRMRAVLLDELPCVELLDVENWIRDQRYFRNLCPVHTRSFCNIPTAAESIAEIFETSEAHKYGGKLPMQFIAPKLIKVIQENRC